MTPTKQIDSRFTEKVSAFLSARDYTGLFKQGCCFHFALRLYLDRRIPLIDGCLDSSSNDGCRTKSFHHVWLVFGNHAFDIEGVKDRDKFNDDMIKTHHGNRLSITSIDPLIIQAKIDEKPLPPSVESEVYDRVLSIFDGERRFEMVRRFL